MTVTRLLALIALALTLVVAFTTRQVTLLHLAVILLSVAVIA